MLFFCFLWWLLPVYVAQCTQHAKIGCRSVVAVCAAAIILPIIRAEGLRAVFAPWLVRHPSGRAASVTRASSRLVLAGSQSGIRAVD